MKKKCSPIEPALIVRLRALQGSMSLYQFAEMMGIARATMAAAMGGLALHPGTRLLITTKLSELTAGNVAQVETAANAA